MKRLAVLMFTAALASSSANAQILLSDNFNTENGGSFSTNYNAFINWTVAGQVDLVNAALGITCVAPSGSCVDLDGSSGPGKLVSKSAFAFATGQTIRISFDISGNQRGGSADFFQLGLDFGAGANIASFLGTGGLAFATGSGGGPTGFQSFSTSLLSSDPFSNWSVQFVAASGGVVRYSLGTTSADNVGPILDNVVVQNVLATTVPEPSSWALMAFGLGGMGVAARRRVRKV